MRIIHISDLHAETAPERAYPGVLAVLDRARDALAHSGADLVIVSGDLTSYGSSRSEDLVLAREWIESIGRPWLAVPGNHDLGANTQRGKEFPDAEAYHDGPLAGANYGQVFGGEPVVSADLDGLLVAGVAVRDGDPDRALPALEERLAAHAGAALVFGHYPVEPVRGHGVLASFGIDEFVPRTAPRLAELIARHPQVVLYACGHVHVASTRPIAPHCLQVTAGALGPGASVYRCYEVTRGGIAFSSLIGPGPLTFWERLAPFATYGAEYSLGAPEERGGRVVTDS